MVVLNLYVHLKLTYSPYMLTIWNLNNKTILKFCRCYHQIFIYFENDYMDKMFGLVDIQKVKY